MNTLTTNRTGTFAMESMLKKVKTETPMSDDMLSDDLEPIEVSPKWQSHGESHPPMEMLFRLCRENKWSKVLGIVNQYPLIGNQSMTMDNHITTTIIHQAITSKGDTAVRARVISTILKHTPEAAQTKNGYGSMPLHVIAQRNTKIDSTTKERLINEIIDAYPEALTEAGGVGKRTPLHIIFTARLTKRMVDLGAKACFMKDKHGYLPAHVACRRHTSPDKLRMLLAVNPGALYERNNDGRDLIGLAEYHATKSHPNYALIEELKRQMKITPIDNDGAVENSVPAVSSEDSSEARDRSDSNGSYMRSWHEYSQGPPPPLHHGYGDRHPHQGAPPDQYEPHVISYQTLNAMHGSDHRQYGHAPRLQTFQYDQRDLVPLPYSPSGSASMVSGSQCHYGTEYHHEPASMVSRSNGAERFHYHDHGRPTGMLDPTPYYGDPGHGRHYGPISPSIRRHEHHTEHSIQSFGYRGMDPPANTTYHVKRHVYGRDVSAHVPGKFNGHIETNFAEPPNYEVFNRTSPRFADLSPHASDFDIGPLKPNSALSNGRKRKAHFFPDDEPVPDLPEEAGASLLLHFSRRSGQGPADATAQDTDGGRKCSYKGGDLLFEV